MTSAAPPPRVLRIAVLGDSIASGLGVAAHSYADVLATAADPPMVVRNFSYTGFSVTDSLDLLPSVLQFDPDVVLVAHGIFEAVVIPNAEAMRWVPNRWRQKGWLDPRPYFSRRPLKGLYQRLESATRWRYKALLVALFGGGTPLTADAFHRQLRQLLDTLLSGTRAIVVLVTHCGIDGRFYPGSPASFAAFKAVVDQTAAHLKWTGRVVLCDVSETLESPSDCFADRFHPNAAGHRKIADALRARLLDWAALTARQTDLPDERRRTSREVLRTLGVGGSGSSFSDGRRARP
jgi:lysophospholipase L1-like esterase